MGTQASSNGHFPSDGKDGFAVGTYAKALVIITFCFWL